MKRPLLASLSQISDGFSSASRSASVARPRACTPREHASASRSDARVELVSGVHTRDAIAHAQIRYELIELLACGGMASVFLAAQCRAGSIDRLVAAKAPHPGLDDGDARARLRLLREARIGARIGHPNVVQTFDLVPGDGRSLLVMEYVEGVTLRDVLPRVGEADAEVPAPVTVSVIRDLLRGLHAAHDLRDDSGERLGVVHRDVAPGNVIVGVDGRARLADFGLAREARELAARATPSIDGTLRYLSPEQARGELVDARADVFAAGVLLWELLAGRRLVEGATPQEIMRLVCQGPIPARLDLDALAARGVPRGLLRVAARALSPGRDDRFPSAEHFARALEAAAVDASCLGSHERIARWVDDGYGTRIERQRERIAEWCRGLTRAQVAAR